MTCKKIFVRFVFGIVACLALAQNASAQLLNDINLTPGPNGALDVDIKFSVPIRYVRHLPVNKSDYFTIYFGILSGVPASQWQDFQSSSSPPSDIVREISVSTRDLGSGPKVEVRFFRPTQYSVSMGGDGQSLLIRIIPDKPQQKSGSGTSALVPAPAVPLPPAIVPTPTAPAITAAATAPPAAAPVGAASNAAEPAPSGDVIVPSIVLPPASGKPIRIPLGGKDGLPVFPELDQVAPGAAPPSANPTPAEQLRKVTDEAAALMLQGGNFILAGQPFAAIEPFNKVLLLPPNKYSEDALVWIGIAKERAGQLPRAVLEYQSYLKHYPRGKWTKWVNDRMTILKIAAPNVFIELAKPVQTPGAPIAGKSTPFQVVQFGSLAEYYYFGSSQVNTTGANMTSPVSLSATDQKSLMSNANLSARFFNNEYDNRLVFQDFYAKNMLQGQSNSNRLGAFFYDLNSRVDNYSVRVGRQSGLGGGVLGRFDGVSAGKGFAQNYRINVVGGQLSDVTLDAKPVFFGTSMDFGIRAPLGGSIYAIQQKVQGFKDRSAVGGNLRYFNQGMSIMSLVDYDTQFKALNIFTLQGTFSNGGKGNDYNFLLDHRRSPVLDVRNAVSGTTTTVKTLLDNGFTIQDLILLANQRTTTTNMAQVGMTNYLSEKWITGTDVSVSKTAALAESGTLLPDGSTGLEGYVPATPSSGNAWTVSERLTGRGILKANDILNYILSYSKSQLSHSEAFQFSDHVNLGELWALDSTVRVASTTDNTGGKATDLAPTMRLSYKIRKNLTTDGQLGVDWNKYNNEALQTSTKTRRYFVSLGFQWSF